MVVYDLAAMNLTNFTGGMGELVKVANNGTQGLLVGLFLVVVFLVLLFSFFRFGDFVRALAGSSFICFLGSLFLVSGGLLNVVVLLAFLFMTAISALFLYFEE